MEEIQKMIVENKSIVITDPCYLKHGIEKDVDVNLSFYGKKDYSEPMYSIGLTNFIIDSTKCGDWGCTAYNIGDYDIRNHKTIHELEDFYDNNINKEKNIIGKFCADSGMVCVVLAEELRKFNPSFFEWALCSKLCVTYIPNYTGEIGFFDVKKENSEYNTVFRHIYGIGKGSYGIKNFATFQTGY